MFKSLFQILSQKNLMIQSLEISEEALGKSERLTRAAFAALLDGKQPDFDLYQVDREINRAETQVRRNVLQHLAVNPEADLTHGLVLISTIIDIERIGDYAKNVYDQVELSRGWGSDRQHTAVREMVDETLSMFGKVSESMRSGDRDKAKRVMDEHRDIGRRCEALIEEIVKGEGLSVHDAVILALTCRFLKRISAHLSNLASSVVNPFDRIGFKPGPGAPEDADT